MIGEESTPAKAVIRQVGRFSYDVWVECGAVETSGITVLGRCWAERQARRQLARYRRRQSYSRTEIT